MIYLTVSKKFTDLSFSRIESKTASASLHCPFEQKKHSQGNPVVSKGTQFLIQTFCASLFIFSF